MMSSFTARLAVFSFGLCLFSGFVACSRSSQPNSAPVLPTAAEAAQAKLPSPVPPQEQTNAEDQILLATSKAIRQAHLTPLKDECLAYDFQPNVFPDAYLVDVRENHRQPACGGDPQTQPKIFSVKVGKASGKMWTDQGSPGQFHPLPDTH